MGTLLGRGLTYPEAREELSGVTLESVAVTKVVIEALKCRNADMGQYPLLYHIYQMLTENMTVDVPWQAFEESL